uniref:Uncharacterized protein n=1 Tax=Arcella intermedia TaxID=1963864 RepID=A0A6B2L8B2_9EUKA
MVLVIADPQLTAEYSYNIDNPWKLKVIKYYSDIYMKRYFESYMGRYDISGVVVLGDMFDGVTNYLYSKHLRTTWTEEEYQSLEERWKWIFQTDVPFYNVSGNHDVGFNIPFGQDKLVQRYRKTFGALNHHFEIGGVEFVVIAATAVYKHWANGDFYQETDNFINSYSSKEKTVPRILLTHIPFFRDIRTHCGEENGDFHVPHDTGYGYLTQFDEQKSSEIISIIKPDFILSGDIHHDCYFIRSGGIHDYVINTFSWMQGNPNPGAAILTIQHTSDKKPMIYLTPCRHHNQILLYIIYLLCFTLCESLWFYTFYFIHNFKASSSITLAILLSLPLLAWYLFLQYLSY